MSDVGGACPTDSNERKLCFAIFTCFLFCFVFKFMQ